MTAAPPPGSFDTLGTPGQAETRVQRSRFVAYAAPVADEAAARAYVDEIGRRHHDARHVCWAARFGLVDDPREIRADSGEPAGTAGEPILRALRQAGITDCVGVVVRWFGGVKLGTGGLGRAYGEAAALAVAAAARRTVLLGVRAELVFPYALQKTVRHHLDGHEGRIESEEYGAEVRWTVWLPRGRAGELRERLVEASADALAWRDLGESAV
ncbi:MAG: DUF1949 domain-containing protein [bacterium]|nr:DUF1949 domain-containing protein [bacterium]